MRLAIVSLWIYSSQKHTGYILFTKDDDPKSYGPLISYIDRSSGA